jgi:RHS repeat-associated protein
VDLASAPNQEYLVTLDLAAPLTGFNQTVNNLFEVTWGNIDLRLGVLYTLPVDLQEDARSVKLNWIGTGATFQVSTDSGRTWEDAENGQVTSLKNYGRKLMIRAYLFLDVSTVLDSYSIQINPATFMLFTGKVLEETGLIYFGARWYDPEIGIWISPDPGGGWGELVLI